ncbi:non-ribosomal peptide synthetase [Ktedonosporobacter rubrisoli]|uniref:non-ribosomal peptide synthetase n=1 Tax=Ktedonosporobacter rubrisoli TaxID=2509675 RepID=UPI0013EE987C|nr:non-ribosomal peptide synthetase [Ktedonosporobacter rubrisoli]
MSNHEIIGPSTSPHDPLDAQFAYWQQQLAGIDELRPLPTDMPRTPVRLYRAATHSLRFPVQLYKQLQQTSLQEEIPPFTVLLASLQLLLTHMCGQEESIVGTSTAISIPADSESQAHCLTIAKTLALRTRITGNLTVHELFARVHAICLQASAHMEVSFEQVMEQLFAENPPNSPPLLQVMLDLQDEPSYPFSPTPSSPAPLEIRGNPAASQSDLHISLIVQRDNLEGVISYNAALFTPGTIQRFGSRWLHLLAAILADPQQHVCNIQWLEADELAWILQNARGKQRAYASETTLFQAFEAQVERLPDAIVLVAPAEGALSYRKLDQLANQVACALRARGQLAHTPVGLCIPSSLLGAVGLLGIMKAGCIYVPLDPRLPVERRAWMIRQAGIHMVVTIAQFAEQVASAQVQAFCLDREWEEVLQQPVQRPAVDLLADDLACIIYTSGSTGRPKGVMLSHGALCNRMQQGIEDHTPQQGDRMAQIASWGFDISLWELISPWLAGATTFLVPLQTALDSAALSAYLSREQITLLQSVPSLLSTLLQEATLANCSSMRCVLTGGEAVSAELVQRIFDILPIEVQQLYGPTETAISVTNWIGYPKDGTKNLSLGRPIPNTQAYILDAWLQPVLPGGQGELYIGGDCLARGYWQRPDLTAERFIPNPFSSVPGSRLYRTGDIARLLPSGELAYVGRIDSQVKIRGNRVEPEEIEAQIQSYTDIRACAVQARMNQRGELQLVAFIVAYKTAILSIAELRRYLQQRLPAYMLPAAFVQLDDLPLTPNGKVDRHALLRLEVNQLQWQDTYVAPQLPEQERLAAIWGEVLQIERIGIHDNFFALGGHSLLAIRVISRVRETFHLDLPLQTLFEAPTIEAFARHLSQVSTDQFSAPLLPLHVAPASYMQPSFAQERLWFLDQLEGSSAFYNIPFVVSIHLPLQTANFARSLNEIIRRHASLRTVFQAHDGQPVQAIMPELICPVPLIDFSQHQQPEAAIQRCFQDLLSTHFELTRGPLLRAALCKLSSDNFIFMLTIHHIVADGWSLAVLIHELITIYQALQSGKRSSLPDLPIQYRDFACWERSYLQGVYLEQQILYWRNRLADAPALLTLPTDRPRPATQSYRGALYPFSLSPALSERLRAFSRQAEVTLYMTMLGAFQILLTRYSGQHDIVIGTPVAGRNRLELEDLIGFFVNMLALRLRLEGNSSFREVIKQVKKVAQEAYAHQEAPFERIVEALKPERSLSYHPLFQVSFAWEEVLFDETELAHHNIKQVHLDAGISRFDLTLFLWEEGDCLTGYFEYSTDLFERETIARWAQNLQVLLDASMSSPDCALNRLPLLSSEEHQRLLYTWNPPALTSAPMLCIHEQFEAVAASMPDSLAICQTTHALSFHCLDQQANRLARFLIAEGIGPEICVAVYTERSAWMVIAMLAILKAGGAYVPLDPSLPHQRIAFILRDAHCPIVLTQSSLLGALSSLEQTVKVFCFERDWPIVSNLSATSPDRLYSNKQLAYVIYTSGSTGRPKGVGITHLNLSNMVSWYQQTFAPTPADRSTHLVGLGFDVSVWELWTALLAGAQVWLCEDEVRSDPQLLLAWLSDCQITVSFVPTPLAEQLLTRPWPQESSLRILHTGGDALHPVTQPHLPFSLINNYGPSECTVVTTSGPIFTADAWNRMPDIGRPIARVQVYLLDTDLQIVPQGAVGELVIGGENVGRGYIGNPAMTAERFIPDPFGSVAGGRLYRTGDLARYRNDGVLEFVGREDQQVKIRGFRIELGEIETVLQQFDPVQECIVLAREDQPGERQLVAYVTHDPRRSLAIRDLQLFLRERLPAYMLPAAYVMLAEFPLNKNGKIDRRALPAPAYSPWQQENFVIPSTPTQELLAQLWMNILHIPQISIHDNFFELGGHSLLATRIISRINEALHVDVPLRVLFGSPTIAHLATYIDDLAKADTRSSSSLLMAPLTRQARGGSFPLSFAQEQLWFLHELEPDSPFYNIALSLRLRGPLQPMILQQSLNTLIQRHEALRTTFAVQHDHPVQYIADPAEQPLIVVDLSTLSQAQRSLTVSSLSLEQARLPFNLRREPPMRLMLLRLDEQAHVLLMCIHHIVMDGWSLNMLLQELEQSYTAYEQGDTPRQSKAILQYVDYVLWQRAWLQSTELEEQLAYWKQRMAGAPVLLELPTDHARPAIQSYRGATQIFPLPAVLTTQLRQLSQQHGITLFSTLLSAYLLFLARYSGQYDVVVGTPMAGRIRPELEEIAGLFVNILPLRFQINERLTFLEFMQMVQQDVLEAYAHQALPFEQLVEALQAQHSTSYQPVVQLTFALQDEPESFQLGQVQAERSMVATNTAKFDLALTCEETAAGLRTVWEYNTDLFEPETIVHLKTMLQELLQAIVAQSGQQVYNFSLLSEPERQYLLKELNATSSSYHADMSVVALFEDQVRRSPDSIALSDEQGLQVTYEALNRRANQLAHALRMRGVGTEVAVGFYAERSLHLILGLLAVLKAGGFYIPIDTSTPTERLAFLLTDANIHLLFVKEQLAYKVPTWQGITLDLEQEIALSSQQSTANPGQYPRAQSLAYVNYTSGTTGRPKGVAVPQQAITRLVLHSNYIQITPQDVVVHISNSAFDASTFEIWGALLNGARILSVEQETALMPEALEQHLYLRYGNVMFLTSALFNQLARLRPQIYQRMRVVLFGGEAANPPAVRSVRATSAPEHLIHVYGPTENTTFSTYRELDEVPAEALSVPIGYPLANSTAFVLDKELRLVPRGAIGELYVGGAGLARGYLQQADLTANSFIPHPFSAIPGARLYKTGDLVRYVGKWELDFVGRVDTQVKIHGFRIEPAEIEALLQQHPAVAENAVLPLLDPYGERRLVAYLLARSQEHCSNKELRQWLQERLPSYMVPTVFVWLSDFSLTKNGKLDRKSLPQPQWEMLERSQPYQEPTTPLTQQLAEIWQEVLQIERIGLYDNFFELGGHSLLLTQVVSRVRSAFQIDFPLRVMFEHPTIAEISAFITEQRADEIQDAAVPSMPIPALSRGGGDLGELLTLLENLPSEEVEALLMDQVGGNWDEGQ